jgi:hypothetical protein
VCVCVYSPPRSPSRPQTPAFSSVCLSTHTHTYTHTHTHTHTHYTSFEPPRSPPSF